MPGKPHNASCMGEGTLEASQEGNRDVFPRISPARPGLKKDFLQTMAGYRRMNLMSGSLVLTCLPRSAMTKEINNRKIYMSQFCASYHLEEEHIMSSMPPPDAQSGKSRDE